MGPIMGGLPLFKYTATNAVVAASGTSLVAMIDPWLINPIPPINSQFTVSNFGVNGQGIGGARGGAATKEDTVFNPAKKNIILFWGAINSLVLEGLTGQQAFDQVALYVQERLAIHPEWKIILTTETPAYGSNGAVPLQSTVNANNARIDDYNVLLRNKYRETGAVGLADMRYPGSPFNLPDYTYASFTAIDPLWDAGLANYRVHFSQLGYSSILMPQWSAALRRIRLR